MLIKNIFFAAIYFLLAQLTVSLSISLNCISFISAGAGLALAGIYIYGLKISPGLLAGMLASRLFSLPDSLLETKNIIFSLLFCLIITAAAFSQALLGNWLIKRRVLADDPLIEDSKIIFFMFAGISTCALSALISTACFALWQLIPWSDYLSVWLIEWMGNSLGVLVFAPLILIAFAEPRAIWQQRIKSVAIPLYVILFLILALFNHLCKLEQSRFYSLFETKITVLHSAFKSEIHQVEEINPILKAFFDNSEFVTANEFYAFTFPLRQHHVSIASVDWILRIDDQNRQAFESTTGKNLRITEKSPLNQLITATHRKEYFPILFASAPCANASAKNSLGFDIGSLPEIASTLQTIQKTAKATISEPLPSESSHEKGYSYIIFSPIYLKNSQPGTKTLYGLTATTFHFNDLVQAVLKNIKNTDVYLKVYDQNKLVYSNIPSGIINSNKLKLSYSLALSNRLLTIVYIPSAGFFSNQSSWSLSWILAVGYFLIGFTAVTLLMLTGRTLKTENIIKERTLELENARQQLSQHNINLLQALKKSQQASRAKNLFLANMSHELRTPLNAILGFSQLLTQQDSITESQKEKLLIINQSGEHLLKLINEVLDIAKIESGQTALQFSDFSFIELLNELHHLFQERCKTKNVNLSFNYNNDIPVTLHADKTKLRQILVNLIDNAIKATRNGSVTVNVHYQDLNDHLAKLYVEVVDTGVGICKAHIKDIFKNFTCFNSTDNYEEGTGLGLSITQHFVHLMGGEISVDSKINQGSEFKFSVLIDKIKGYQAKNNADNRVVIGMATPQPCRILVVDNFLSNRYLLTSFLSPIGFELKEAENGQQAIEIWRSWQPHLILMDIRMPILNGYKAIRLIKKSLEQPVVIIAITASVFEEKKNKIIQSGCDDFISKPFSITELLVMIQKHTHIEYIYQENSLEEAKVCFLDKESFCYLNDNLKKELYIAIQSVDINKIELLIEKVALEDKQLAKVIKNKINNFKYEALLELLEP